MRRLPRLFPVLAWLAFLAFAAPQSAGAYSFDLAAANFPGYTGPYVTVTVDLTSSTTADITFTSQTTGGYSFLLIDGSSAALSVNASSFSVSALAATQPAGFNPVTLSTVNPPGTSVVDGWGLFNLVINSSAGYASASSEITFTVTNNAGTWANDTDVLTQNEGGNAAAAHVAVCTAPCTKDAGALVTGYVSGDGFPVVPEPGTFALVGLGLVGLASAARRR